MKRHVYIGLLIASCSGYVSLAQSVIQGNRPSPASIAQVAQSKIADCVFGSRSAIGFGNSVLSASEDGTVTLTGHNRTGQRWTANYSAAPGAGCQLWSFRWPGDTNPGLALVLFGVNSSGGWDTTLSLLQFDQDGLPFPWQATSKFNLGENGVQELVMLEETRTPAVLVPLPEPSGTEDSGREFREYVPRGMMFRESADKESARLAQTSLGTGTTLNRQTLATSTLFLGGAPIPSSFHTFKGVVGTNNSDRRIVLSNITVRMPDVVVIDSAVGRKITSFPVKLDLDTVPIGSAKGVPLGTDCSDGDCHPVIVWFKQ